MSRNEDPDDTSATLIKQSSYARGGAHNRRRGVGELPR